MFTRKCYESLELGKVPPRLDVSLLFCSEFQFFSKQKSFNCKILMFLIHFYIFTFLHLAKLNVILDVLLNVSAWCKTEKTRAQS